MTFTRAVLACAAPIALSLSVLSAPALAQTSPAFERAILNELDPATRADVQKRVTKGNSVSGVIGTILLNRYQAAGPKNAGAALTVVALDFARGRAVLGSNLKTYEIIKFDTKTLKIIK